MIAFNSSESELKEANYLEILNLGFFFPPNEDLPHNDSPLHFTGHQQQD